MDSPDCAAAPARAIACEDRNPRTGALPGAGLHLCNPFLCSAAPAGAPEPTRSHMTFDPTEIVEPRVVTLAQLTRAGAWQLALAHDRAEHLLIWLTRGQGTALLDGALCGVGANNAIFVPARTLLALDLGRQTFGHAVLIPAAAPLRLPAATVHLRLSEATAQTELAVLFAALEREQSAARPLHREAVVAHAGLLSIWLRRQMVLAEPPPPPTAARRLSRRYCARLVSGFASGAGMAGHAAALGVTPTHLSRVCRAETGRTAAALLAARLLHAARQLLVATPVPAQDIARHLGFGSAAYFTRFIRHHTGMTPTELRRAARPGT